MTDQKHERFEEFLAAESAIKDILFMYWTLAQYRGLFDDFGTESGQFDPFFYLDFTPEYPDSVDEENLRLLHEGSGIKIACWVLQEYCQGGYPSRVSPFMERVRKASAEGRFAHLPPIETAIREGLESEYALATRQASLYDTYVAARFESWSSPALRDEHSR